ncbi:MAG TPA: DUF6064 family protein [Gemmatimonadales bacterium]|jgi:hypothetical protein
MPEWWTYSLTDFLLFSPRTYYRLIERHNLALWPAQLAALALGALIAGLLRRPSRERGRAIAAILAVLWAWVGWAFIMARYATINWAATYFASLFAAEALLLGWLGVARADLRFGWRRDPAGLVGGAIFVGAVALYPLLAPVLERGWTQAELFGIAPDPTVLGTLGLLLLAEGSQRPRHALLAAPLVWCLLSGATLWALASPEAWIVLAAAALVPVVSRARGRPAA